jgi:probable rRNA maturation factor
VSPSGGAPATGVPAVEGHDERGDAEGDDPDLAVDLASLTSLLASVLAAEGIPPRAEASLTLVGPDAIAALNAEHLGGSGPTDVLSFPVDGAGPVPDGEPWLVGDVVVCPTVAARQAADHAGTADDELALLVTHGGLHLCGWDHDTDAARAAMWDRERELMTALGRTPSADPWSDR